MKTMNVPQRFCIAKIVELSPKLRHSVIGCQMLTIRCPRIRRIPTGDVPCRWYFAVFSNIRTMHGN